MYIGTSLKNDHPNPLDSRLSFCTNEELLKAKISHDEFANLLDQIKSHDAVDEVSLVSTCNRFEIYAFLNNLCSSSIQEIKNIINSINNANIELAELKQEEARLQFLRTYCGLNSGLIGEDEISMQIDISFRQSLTMGYLGSKGESLLEEAISLRKVFDNFVYKDKISYCNIALKRILDETSSIENILVLGSGSTARQACVALKNLGFSPNKITVAHRISSSSGQVATIKEMEGLEGIKFTRTKHGYHTDKAQNLVYNSDLVVFGIDSKLPVINITENSKLKLIDFNSKPSCTFSLGAKLDNYFSAQRLDEEVRTYSKERMQDKNFVSALKHAEEILQEQLKTVNQELAL